MAGIHGPNLYTVFRPHFHRTNPEILLFMAKENYGWPPICSCMIIYKWLISKVYDAQIASVIIYKDVLPTTRVSYLPQQAHQQLYSSDDQAMKLCNLVVWAYLTRPLKIFEIGNSKLEMKIKAIVWIFSWKTNIYYVIGFINFLTP